MRYLVELLRNPDHDIHVLDLAGGREAPAETTPEPVLDPKAKAAYRARLLNLEEELDEAEAFGDLARASRARAERDALLDELAKTTGLGGRDRRMASATERARVNVTRTLRLVLDKIGRSAPGLGGHLNSSVSTGTFCSYRPAEPVAWDVG